MTHPQANTRPPSCFVFIRVLCTVALGISAYPLFGSLTGERLAGCGPESGCDAVLRSRWANILGLPVSLSALLLARNIDLYTANYYKFRKQILTQVLN